MFPVDLNNTQPGIVSQWVELVTPDVPEREHSAAGVAQSPDGSAV